MYYETMALIVKISIVLVLAIILFGIGYAFGYSDGKEQ